MLGGLWKSRFVNAVALRRPVLTQHVRTKKKKAGGSTVNGGGSPGKRLGVKVYPNGIVKANDIIFTQRGTKWRPGFNCGIGRNHNIFSLIPGFVKYYRVRNLRGQLKKYIGVEPFGFEESLLKAELVDKNEEVCLEETSESTVYSSEVNNTLS